MKTWNKMMLCKIEYYVANNNNKHVLFVFFWQYQLKNEQQQ